MKYTINDLLIKAEGSLRACLEKVPFVKIEDFKKGEKDWSFAADLLVDITLPGGKKTLLVEIKNNGQPRYAREAINQMFRYRDKFPGAYGVFMAPYISQESAEICQREGIGYIDFSGNCLLCFDQVYIEEKGKPNLFAKRRDLRSLYSPKAERVLRVMLNNPKRVWKIKDLKEEAGVSLGQVSNVKKLLGGREWITIQKDGVLLGNPEKLLEEWAENYSFRRNSVRDFYSLKNPSRMEESLAIFCKLKGLRYALTGFSGAVRLAPAVRYQRVFVYMEETEEEIVRELELKEVQSGANVSILTPYDDGVFYGSREVDGVHIASPVQIYLDLVGFRGRGEEAAMVIREEIIRPQW